MKTLKFDLNKNFGKFKILNATNGGPFHRRHTNTQFRTNFQEYKDARIPYSRNHDSNFNGVYGGPYIHDISVIFPNFDADVNSPESYNFENTDENILATLDAGTKTFFRLGQSIEHQIKKMHIFPPKDYLKWAKICEHIIRHYTEGWANGFTLDMPYWEIWNEPDLDYTSDNKRCWTGTKEEFFDFFEVVVKYLKGCFPNLKIGGPAIAHNKVWAEDFLCEMQKRNVTLDFLSWHLYGSGVQHFINHVRWFREKLDKYGYKDTESILNEWNYIKGWVEEFVYSVEVIHSMKGAAFLSAVMLACQKEPVDMLMYYDTRPSVYNGLFDYYTYRPLKGYTPFKWYGEFYDLEYEVREESSIEDLYTICGVDKNGKITALVTHYSDNDENKDIEFKLDFGRDGEYDIYLLDSSRDGEKILTTNDLTFKLPVNSCLKIKQK